MFDVGKYYRNDDPALDIIGLPSTRAHWRCEGEGPPFVKLAGRIHYRGADLNEWIESKVIRPKAHEEATTGA